MCVSVRVCVCVCVCVFETWNYVSIALSPSLPLSPPPHPFLSLQVTVPQWLFTHSDDFGKPVWNDQYSNSSFHYLSDFSLLSYIQSHIGREQSELLQPLVVACEAAMARKLPLPVKIAVKKDAQEFGYQFPSEGHHRMSSGGEGGGQSEQQSPQSSPKILRKRFSRLRERQTSIPEITESQMSSTGKGYSFTPEVLTFVTHQSPLVAALIHLLCPPPSAPPSVPPATTGRVTSKGASSEEDGTTGIGTAGESASEGERDEKEREDSGRKASMFSLRGRSRTQLARRTSYDLLMPLAPSVSSWQRELDDILVQFVTFGPMQQFLNARLASFSSILTWDSPGAKGNSSKRSRSAHSSALPEPHDSLRCLALLPSRGNELGSACAYTIHRLLEMGRVRDAVRFLSSEPVAGNRNRVHLLRDLALSSAFVESYSEVLALGQSGEMARESLTTTVSPLSLLFQLSDTEMATRLVLSSLHNWPVDICHNLLSFCLHHLPPSSPLLAAVQGKLERIAVYASIMDQCKSLLFTRSAKEKRGEQKSWRRWSDLASDSESRPQYVLDVLLAEKAFDLARKWASVHSLSQSIVQVGLLSPCVSLHMCSTVCSENGVYNYVNCAEQNTYITDTRLFYFMHGRPFLYTLYICTANCVRVAAL